MLRKKKRNPFCSSRVPLKREWMPNHLIAPLEQVSSLLKILSLLLHALLLKFHRKCGAIVCAKVESFDRLKGINILYMGNGFQAWEIQVNFSFTKLYSTYFFSRPILVFLTIWLFRIIKKVWALGMNHKLVTCCVALCQVYYRVGQSLYSQDRNCSTFSLTILAMRF